MNIAGIQSCYLGPHISPEEFVAEHIFLFLNKGKIEGYDGSRHYTLLPGHSCIIRRNHLARYNKHKESGGFGKVVIVLDEAFLKTFQAKHLPAIKKFASPSAFLRIKNSNRVISFLETLQPYYTGGGKIDAAVEEQKREELLLLILDLHPAYAAILFEFGKPGKIDLEAFINKNYKFNVSLERLAFLSGRSLSAFKRDFAEIFGQTPNRWLVERRLQEARFLLEQKKKNVTEFYLDLGFEDLSHFSFAFKKRFGQAPTALL